MAISPLQYAFVPAADARQLKPPAAAAAPSQEAVPEAPPPQPSIPAPAKLSTNLRIDSQRHIYYEVINDKSGDVVMEIPPEQIRRLEEGGQNPPPGHGLDVKS